MTTVPGGTSGGFVVSQAVETKTFPPNYRPPLLTVSNHVTVVWGVWPLAVSAFPFGFWLVRFSGMKMISRSKFATIAKGVNGGALPLPVNIMFASNRSAWDPTHNGSTSLPLLKTPNTECKLNCWASSEWYFDYKTSRRCLDHIVKCRDWSRLRDTTSHRVWGKFTDSCRVLLRILAAALSRQSLHILSFWDLSNRTKQWPGHGLYLEWC